MWVTHYITDYPIRCSEGEKFMMRWDEFVGCNMDLFLPLNINLIWDHLSLAGSSSTWLKMYVKCLVVCIFVAGLLSPVVGGLAFMRSLLSTN